MVYQLSEIVRELADGVIKVHGTLDRTIIRVCSLSSQGPGGLCYSTTQIDLPSVIRASTAEAILCSDDPSLDTGEPAVPTLVVVREPRKSFIQVVERFFAPSPPQGISPKAAIHPDATIGSDVFIGDQVVVGHCEIGDRSVIYPNAVLHDGTRVRSNVTIHAGAVIGGSGFGYARQDDGSLTHFPHIGGVLIEDNVEIGANTCIDRGTLDDTVIRQGAKIDNLVHIAHNVEIGPQCLVIAHAMIGGSVRVGPRAWIAPSASIRDGLIVGSDALVGMGAVVVHDVPEGSTVKGSPAR